ncbi:hypothetical protein [Alkalihalobacillus sp. TS-13]|uniref:hypothetical protein n=1 Tax=Alkalihalobacillus sp. TS-13 TaxID=2842455 RepID=UPI001C866E60|nr:hypothetical protein [Alkalihalobacillus sp. TS-13]
MLINKEKYRRFKNNFTKISDSHEMLKVLVKEYIKEGYQFHRLFLHSKVVYSLNFELLLDLSSELSKLKIKNSDKVREDLLCLSQFMRTYEIYKEELKLILEQNRVRMEDLFYFLEFLKRKMLTEGKGIDNISYPSEILKSQYNHLLDSFPEVIRMIQNEVLPTDYREPKQIKRCIPEIFRILLFITSVRGLIDSICIELYRPKIVEGELLKNFNLDKGVFLEHNLTYWKNMEITRDLNQKEFYNYSLETKENIKLLEDNQALKLSNDGKVMNFDFSKGNLYVAAKEVRQAYKLLEPLYNSPRTKFIHDKKEFYMEDLLRLYEKIYSYALEKHDHYKIEVLGEKRLIKYLHLNKNEKTLLRTLSFNIGKDNVSLVNSKPLLRLENKYFIVPTWITSLSIDSNVDKVLSNTEVIFDSDDKGYAFEKSIENLFDKHQITFGKVKHDKEKNVPEIDGIFSIDDYIFIFEAKTSIKPNSIQQAYYILNNSLKKAEDQLKYRVDIITNDIQKRKIIEEKSKVKIEGKKILPFVLTNHCFFNGYRELLKNREIHLPIIDYASLNRILEKKSVPLWDFSTQSNCYIKKEVSCKDGKDLESYMLNQAFCIRSMEKPTLQVSETGAVFSIVKPISICN